MTVNSTRLDPGKARGLQRAASADGFFLVCAIDHLHDFVWLLDEDPNRVAFEDVVRAKDVIVRAGASVASAFLIDPLYGIGHLVPAGTVPRTAGLITAIEEEGYTFPAGPRTTRLRPGWSIAKAKLAGADAAKILWFYRADASTAIAQRDLLGRQIAASSEWSLPLVVEPIWYPLPGEDPSTPAWQERRRDGIVDSAALVAQMGADMLKTEFPGHLGSDAAREAALEACAAIDSSVSIPWVVLSAGVGFEEFENQVEIASRAGASGYMAGRSIWRDAVAEYLAGRAGAAKEIVVGRLGRLNDIIRRHGHPYRPGAGLDACLQALAPRWYESWHSSVPRR
jgi:tagatose 1,6-diphosphate aldolase